MLIYIDGFDTYNTADIGQRLVISAGTPTIVTTSPRTGAQVIQDGNPGFTGWGRVVPSNGTYIHGRAIFRTAGNPGIAEFREGTTTHVRVVFNSASSELKVYRGPSTTLLGSVVISFPTSTWTYFETKCTVHDSTGVVEVRLNGSTTPVINLTGQDTRNGRTGIIDNIRHVSISGVSIHREDDWYICDTTGTVNNDFLGDVRVNTLVPNGDGALTQLATTFPATPTTHFDKVDDILHDGDATYNEGSVDNAIDLFTLDDLPVFGAPTTIHGIQTQIVAKKLDAGAKSLQERFRVDTTDFTGASQALSTSYAALLQTREVNPVTGVKFTESDINTAIQVGYEVLP